MFCFIQIICFITVFVLRHYSNVAIVTTVAWKPVKQSHFIDLVKYASNRSMSSLRNFDIKTYTPRQKNKTKQKTGESGLFNSI